MRLFIVHHGLIHGAGHNYPCALGFKAECERRGLGHRAYVHRNCDPAIAAELGAAAVFPYTPVTALSKDPLCGELQNFLGRGIAFARTCNALAADGAGAEDVVIVQSARHAELYGLAWWLAGRGAQAPRAVVHFWRADFVDGETGRTNHAAQFVRFGAIELKGRTHDRAIFTAPRGVIARAVETVCCNSVLDAPLPLAYPAPATDGTDRRERIRISVLGQSRPEQNFAVLPDLVNLLAHDERIEFFVQASRYAASSLPEPELERLAAMPRVTLFRGAFGAAEYARGLASADIVLLPYRRREYAIATSGVFAEAVAIGRPVVTTAGTWNAEQLAAGRGVGVVARDHSAAAIARAVTAAVDDFEALRLRATAAATSWRRENSIEAYLDKVFATLGV